MANGEVTPVGGSGAGAQDWGKLILRLSLGGLMLLHGIAKVRGGTAGLDPIAAMLTAKGLPEALKYGVYVGEVLAPVLLIVGLLPRLAGVILAGNMGFAVYLAHRADLFSLTEHGGYALELQAFFLLGGLAVALLGGGRLALSQKG